MQCISLRLLGLLLFSLLTLATLRFCAPEIQAGLQNKTQTALHQGGFTWASATADGTQIILSGIAPTSALKIKAEQAIHKLWGPSQLSSKITVSSPLDPFTLKAAYDGQKISIHGYVANEPSKNLILQTLHKNFGDDAVASHLDFAEGQPNHWPIITAGVMKQLQGLNQGQVEFSNHIIHITGTAASDTIATEIRKALQQYQTQDYQVQANIKALPSCQKKFNDAVHRHHIQFTPKGSIISVMSTDVLDQLSQIANNDCPKAKIEIGGYTDNRGNPNYNKTLGQQRAESVLQELVSRGVNSTRLRAKGYGEAHPIASNHTRTGRASNRRIEFLIQNPTGS